MVLNRAVAVTLVAALSRQKLFSSVLLAHRRQREATRRRGSERDRSLTLSPGPEAFPEGTLEIAWVCTKVSRPLHDFPFAPISRAAAWAAFPSVSRRRPRGPPGNAAGPGG